MKIKKFLSVLLALPVFLCVMPLTVSASSLSVSLQAEVTSYDTVVLSLRSDGGYITSGRFFIDFDGDALKYVSSEQADESDMMFAAALANGHQAVVYFTCPATVHNEVFGRLTFHIKNYDKQQVSFGIYASYLYGGSSADADDGVLVSAKYSGTALNLPVISSLYAYPAESNFRAGEISEYLPSYLTVTAKFEDGGTGVIPADAVSVSGNFDGNTPAVYNLTCSAGGVSTQFKVQVYDKDVNKLTVKELPSVTTLSLGENATFSGLRIIAEYAGGTTETLDRTKLVIKGYNPFVTGTQQITVCYCNAQTTFTVNVVDAFKKGDTDGSGEVTVADARLTLRASIGLENWALEKTSSQYRASDVDGREGISVADARLILRVAIKLQSF